MPLQKVQKNSPIRLGGQIAQRFQELPSLECLYKHRGGQRSLPDSFPFKQRIGFHIIHEEKTATVDIQASKFQLHFITIFDLH